MPKVNVGLVMIVRDESREVLERCFRSVRGVCDRALICDTGSVDIGVTLNAVKAIFGDGGRVACHKWQDFAHNRTEAVRLAAQSLETDYLLTIDADEVLYTPPGSPLIPADRVGADVYAIPVDYHGMRYARYAVMRSGVEWRYEWPVHEVLRGPDTCTYGGSLDQCVIVPSHDGARSKNPNKYRDDAHVLAKWCLDHPTDTRGTYYLAQSYRDAGEMANAAKAYRYRVKLGGWEEEVWSAALEAVKCDERILWARGDAIIPEIDVSRVVEAYLEVRHLRPWRAEPLWHAMRFATQTGYGAIAEAIRPAWEAITLPKEDLLFVETWAYRRV